MSAKKKDVKPRIPTIVVIIGATGDLMTKKIVPALYNLFAKDSLPRMFRVVGFARRDLTDSDFRERVREILKKHVNVNREKKRIEKFLSLYSYERGTFENEADYARLSEALKAVDGRWGMCSNKLLYLAVPPRFYPEILKNISASGLSEPCGGPEEGWTRVIVEKPFGSDEKSAKALDAELAKLFSEDQIYRIDHYLAKETFQNVMAFRFFNNLFEDNWGNELIESVRVREFENIGVEDRGPFYDAVGALRDVGQNHLLQMVALVTMDQPESLEADAVRKNRASILQTLVPLSFKEVKRQTFRAQYEGYRSVKGVRPDSDTETYFRARFSLAHPRWRGVTFIMEAGKRLMNPGSRGEITEIEVTFRHPRPCLCPPGKHYRNSVVFKQDPAEGITIHFWSKKPGLTMELEERTFDFDLRKTGRRTQYTEEYEKLLLDCISDNQMLFVSSAEISAMWRFIDSIIAGWRKNTVPLKHYRPDNSSISAEAEALDNGVSLNGLPAGEIGIFGLGKMGRNVARQLRDKGWRVVAANRSQGPVDEIGEEGFETAFSIEELISKLKRPRVVWLMITAGKGVDDALFGKGGLTKFLDRGDVVIDAGNSFFEDTVRRSKLLAKRGIRFMDVGFSGGPSGARHGGSLMIGGEPKTFESLGKLFADLSVPGGYARFGEAGAGHFVKMVHNGIEYGMMQSLAEGFALMKKSPFKLNLKEVAAVYNRGSVIESRLVGWLENAFRAHGEDLKGISGSVVATGEGEWTILTARKRDMKLPAIEDAFKFRMRSKKSPSYMGRILSALRNQFGGHSVSGGTKGTKKKS